LGVEKRLSEEQIIGFLREAEAGVPVKASHYTQLQHHQVTC
jgi:hypothetical protein